MKKVNISLVVSSILLLTGCEDSNNYYSIEKETKTEEIETNKIKRYIIYINEIEKDKFTIVSEKEIECHNNTYLNYNCDSDIVLLKKLEESEYKQVNKDNIESLLKTAIEENTNSSGKVDFNSVNLGNAEDSNNGISLTNLLLMSMLGYNLLNNSNRSFDSNTYSNIRKTGYTNSAYNRSMYNFSNKSSTNTSSTTTGHFTKSGTNSYSSSKGFSSSGFSSSGSSSGSFGG